LFLFYGTIKRRGVCFRASFAAAMSVSKGANAGQAVVRLMPVGVIRCAEQI
jgi:hypothetical protein